MAMTSLSVPVNPSQLKLITTAELTPKIAYAYEEGKRTDKPRIHPEGWPVHKVRDLTGSLLGEAVEVTIETSTPDAFPAGAVIQPDGPATLRVRGLTTAGSTFANLEVVVSAPRWKVVGSIADALGLASATGGDKKTAA